MNGRRRSRRVGDLGCKSSVPADSNTRIRVTGEDADGSRVISLPASSTAVHCVGDGHEIASIGCPGSSAIGVDQLHCPVVPVAACARRGETTNTSITATKTAPTRRTEAATGRVK